MSRMAWLIGSMFFGLAVSVPAWGQVPDPPAPQVKEPDARRPADPFAQLRDKPALRNKAGAAAQGEAAQGETEAAAGIGAQGDAAAEKRLRFPAEGFKGKPIVPLPPLNPQPIQEQALQGRFGNQNANRQQNHSFRIQPPVYLPGYNPNRPYGYPNTGYGYGYPGFVYPGYGYGYGYGVLLPGVGGGVPAGGSNFFGNPHASQYMGNPHASQYLGNPHASQGR